MKILIIQGSIKLTVELKLRRQMPRAWNYSSHTTWASARAEAIQIHPARESYDVCEGNELRRSFILHKNAA